MAKKKTSKKKPSQKKKEATFFAFITTFLSIFGFIIAILFKRDDKYVMFYAKQSLIVFILAILVSFVQTTVSWVPILGGLIETGLTVLVILAWLLSWIYAFSGEMKEIPIVGQFGNKINL